jgi:hypothetical protein
MGDGKFTSGDQAGLMPISAATLRQGDEARLAVLDPSLQGQVLDFGELEDRPQVVLLEIRPARFFLFRHR